MKNKENKKTVLATSLGAICLLIMIFTAILFIKNQSRMDNQSTELFKDASKSVAGYLEKYIETEDEEYLSMSATEVQQMGLMATTVKEVSSNLQRADYFTVFVSSFGVNYTAYKNEITRIKTAFSLISDNPDDDYPYYQLKIAVNNIKQINIQ